MILKLNSHIDSIVKDINLISSYSEFIISMLWDHNVPFLIVYDEFFEKMIRREEFNKFKSVFLPNLYIFLYHSFHSTQILPTASFNVVFM